MGNSSEFPERVEIVKRELLSQGFVKLERWLYRHERYDGDMSGIVQREIVTRFDAVALVPHDPETDKVVLVQQFRLPAHVAQSEGWLWEAIAGLVDRNCSPEEVAVAEASEEAGLTVWDLRLITTAYMSPGASTERIYIYTAAFDSSVAPVGGGGLASEHEDIKSRQMTLSEALAMVEQGDIVDAKTIIALQSLALAGGAAKA